MATKPNLEVPDTVQKSIDNKILIITDKVKTITVSSDEEYAKAADFLTTVILPALSELDDAYDDLISDAHKLHKNMIAKKRKYQTPLLGARKTIEVPMIDWSREKARRAQEEARRIQEAAAEEVRRREEEELLERIEKALDSDDDEADKLIEELNGGGKRESESQAIYIVPLPPVVVNKPKAEGVSIRTLKKYRVVDESKVKREFLMIDEVKIQRIVTAMGKGAEELVGGIEFYEEESVAGSARR